MHMPAGVGVTLCGLATDNIAMFNWGLQKYNDVFLNQLTPQVRQLTPPPVMAAMTPGFVSAV
jgi:hypothetical protein